MLSHWCYARSRGRARSVLRQARSNGRLALRQVRVANPIVGILIDPPPGRAASRRAGTSFAVIGLGLALVGSGHFLA